MSPARKWRLKEPLESSWDGRLLCSAARGIRVSAWSASRLTAVVCGYKFRMGRRRSWPGNCPASAMVLLLAPVACWSWCRAF